MSRFRRAPLFVLAIASMAVLFAGGRAMAQQANPVPGASLYLAPASGSFAIGSTFTVSIYVNTGGKEVNAVQADLSFPPKKLQVVSPSSGKSFLQTWVVQPTYSNVMGTLHFSGAIPSPGFVTSAGLISTVTFRVVDTGTAVIKFMDSSKVLLNDGNGTDILGQTTSGIYTLTVPPPAGPIVTSPTNPDQSKWYKTRSVVLRWAGAPGVQGYSYTMSNEPIDTPNDTPNSTATSATYDGLSDGVHYFHIKALAGNKWGGVTNFAVRVDNTPPAAFTIDISPNDYTSSQNPVIQFSTTDAASGIDYYEIKVIHLDPGNAQAATNGDTPFFVETDSPYLQHFPLGRYAIAVRAYDAAGNYYQTTQNLSIVSPLFQTVGNDGLRVGGLFTLGWPYVFGIAALILFLLGFLFKYEWDRHRDIERRLAKGAAGHPEVAAKLAELQQKKKEYEETLKRFTIILLIASSALGLLGLARHTRAASLSLSPPIINLYPSSLANDEVLYLGGWANVPGATVRIYIEQNETGNTFSGTATTGPDGNWFYSFPQLLDSGHYAAWAELARGDTVSPPSSRVNVTVSPTAIQIGNARLDYAEFYLLLFLLFLAAAIVLLALILVYSRKARIKRVKLEEAIRAAEESLRRGFALLQRDIEAELAGVQHLKLRGPLPTEEAEREDKLRKDLDAVKRYVGKEIWHIEEEEEK